MFTRKPGWTLPKWKVSPWSGWNGFGKSWAPEFGLNVGDTTGDGVKLIVGVGETVNEFVGSSVWVWVLVNEKGAVAELVGVMVNDGGS